MVWAKVEQQAKGKRHAITEIALTDAEIGAVVTLFRTCRDSYWLATVKHEMENVPWRNGEKSHRSESGK